MSIDLDILMRAVEKTKEIVHGMSKDLQVDAGAVAGTYNIMMTSAQKQNSYDFNDLQLKLEKQIGEGLLNGSVSRFEGRIVKVVVY
ncbi:hypothetical protein BFW88_16520 [Pseudomonas fluorescens]|nr:hypothetical protein BFW88_16520 [Pseudomonas fluorescens]OPB07680.1 hypothetical protein BFW92_16445 [Pseudomonas fluorescens]OPB18952.1 hypothetical protein BFW93_16475 [Pseudomonas fluorescens]